MSAEPVDQTRLTAIPAQPPESDGDQMNGFEVVVNFALDELPAWGFAVLGLLTLTAGALEMFMELGLFWSVLVTAGLIAAGIYGGTRFRRLPVVPQKEGSR